ncbi:uncharacterized protein LOC112888599 [Panicum hallii]|uniref:uncharacterized protein LOC112888599 n=1 Tax=Panicum hallii TaxID=206008 RepID=UPI000DF4EA7B|nr:uncharacterized protein LOC112888599 [Panicum hallii]
MEFPLAPSSSADGGLMNEDHGFGGPCRDGVHQQATRDLQYQYGIVLISCSSFKEEEEISKKECMYTGRGLCPSSFVPVLLPTSFQSTLKSQASCTSWQLGQQLRWPFSGDGWKHLVEWKPFGHGTMH